MKKIILLFALMIMAGSAFAVPINYHYLIHVVAGSVDYTAVMPKPLAMGTSYDDVKAKMTGKMLKITSGGLGGVYINYLDQEAPNSPVGIEWVAKGSTDSSGWIKVDVSKDLNNFECYPYFQLLKKGYKTTIVEMENYYALQGLSSDIKDIYIGAEFKIRPEMFKIITIPQPILK